MLRNLKLRSLPDQEKNGLYRLWKCNVWCSGLLYPDRFLPEGTAAHSKEYLEAGKTEKAHEALRYGAEILAGTCVDILERPELLSEIQTEFRERKQKEKDVSF